MPGYVTGQKPGANLLIFRLPAVAATGWIYGLLPVPIIQTANPYHVVLIAFSRGLDCGTLYFVRNSLNLVDDGTGSNAAVRTVHIHDCYNSGLSAGITTEVSPNCFWSGTAAPLETPAVLCLLASRYPSTLMTLPYSSMLRIPSYPSKKSEARLKGDYTGAVHRPGGSILPILCPSICHWTA